ncbi:MAG: hypothetical protein ACEPOV_06360 [Hyphomicrobiales bacterium]
MTNSKLLEGVGAITKLETLCSLESQMQHKVLALEALHPFPGYHGEDLPYQEEPHALFFILRNHLHSEIIVRASQKIQKMFDHSFNAVPATVHIFNEQAYAIRVRDIPYNKVDQLVDAYIKEDILFQKHQLIKPYNSIIRIKKYFQLQEIRKNIYKDLDWKGMYYLNISTNFSWHAFEELTLNLKHNMKDNNFDAATAIMINREGIQDFIRIFDQSANSNKLQTIMDWYVNAIERMKYV